MKLVITDPAKFNLKELHDYYKAKATKRVADKIRHGIIEKLKFLQEHPLAGQQEELLGHLNFGHRRFIEGNYKIIYYIDSNIIYVTDIFDARQNSDKMNG